MLPIFIVQVETFVLSQSGPPQLSKTTDFEEGTALSITVEPSGIWTEQLSQLTFPSVETTFPPPFGVVEVVICRPYV